MNPANHTPSAASPWRILLLNASEHVFGAEKSLAALACALQDEGYAFTLASPEGQTRLLFEGLGVEVKPLPLYRFVKTKSPLKLLEQACRWLEGNWRVFQLCRRLNPALIHANGIQSLLYAWGAALALGAPVVWHVRDQMPPTPLVRLCAWLASHIIVPSRAVALEFQRQKQHVIPNLIAISSRSVAPNASSAESDRCLSAWTADSGLFKVGLVGQMIPRKGHDLLLDAIPAILEHAPEARFFFIGGDPFDPRSAYVQALASRVKKSPLLRARVFFIDYTSRMDAIYRQLDAVVIPSRQEAFGRVALEAMAQGCPVAAARTGGLAELIEDGRNGMLFEVESSGDLGRGVIKLAGDEGLRRRLAREGRATAERFEQLRPVHIGQVTGIYSRLGGSASGAGPRAKTARQGVTIHGIK